MRNEKGKLIAVWVPGNHGAGGSTLANALGITLQHLTDKSTLLVNMGSSRNYMEQYLKNDVDIRLTMDYLKSYETLIRAEHIKMYSTAVNEKLHILPNCKISGTLTKNTQGFNEKFVDKAKEAFEIVFFDLEAGMTAENRYFLDRADLILAVMNQNLMLHEELLKTQEQIRQYVYDDKTIVVFNGLHQDKHQESLQKELTKRLGIGGSFGVSYDARASMAACMDGKLYSFMKKELSKQNDEVSLAVQMEELSRIITERLFFEVNTVQETNSFLSMLLSRAKRWGEVDA